MSHFRAQIFDGVPFIKTKKEIVVKHHLIQSIHVGAKASQHFSKEMSKHAIVSFRYIQPNKHGWVLLEGHRVDHFLCKHNVVQKILAPNKFSMLWEDKEV